MIMSFLQYLCRPFQAINFMSLRTLDSISFTNKKALIRVDFNVPLKDGRVSDDTRIRAAVPTIRYILDHGGAVILMSHLGRPKGVEEALSLGQICATLSGLLGEVVNFVPESTGPKAKAAAQALAPGDVLLIENLRFHEEETKGDAEFAKQLAALGDVYVNDAFGTAHRAHASTAVIADYMKESVAGLLMEREVKNAEKVLKTSERPFTAIVGGAKVSSKISVLENLLGKVDRLIIGGGMAYTFLKAQGAEVGSSLVEDDYLEKARRIIEGAEKMGVQMLLPEDSVVADSFSADAATQVCSSSNIPAGWMGLDIGPEATASYEDSVLSSKTILWNGPMGVFEMEAFAKGTLAIAHAVAKATAEHNAYSLIGGGDSVAAINTFGLADQVSFISTGGGAMLEFLEGKILPGVKAVSEN
jgi:phosphoglycerate kinase